MHVDQPLIAAAAKAQRNVVERLHKFAVHQHIKEGKQRVRGLAAAAGFARAGQLLVGIA